jgi:hypothetical protein
MNPFDHQLSEAKPVLASKNTENRQPTIEFRLKRP